MASVLSGWCYGYNIFNIANFIEYHHHDQQQQPLPKRRKLVDNNGYRAVDHHGYQQLHHHQDVVALGRKRPAAAGGHTTTAAGCPIYRPFSIHSSREQQQQLAGEKSGKKQLGGDKQQREQLAAEDLSPAAVEQADGSSGTTTIEHLFPELLCLIFEKLDLQSKGRVAQVQTAF